MSIRDQIWGNYCNILYKKYLSNAMVSHYQKKEQFLNIFLAISSSASIGSWIIWKQYDYIWAGIIAISQVLTAARPYLNYYKYVKEFNTKLVRFANLQIDFEKLWYQYNNGKVTEDEAVQHFFELQKQKNDIDNFGDEIDINISPNMDYKVNLQVANYLNSNFQTDLQIPKPK